MYKKSVASCALVSALLVAATAPAAFAGQASFDVQDRSDSTTWSSDHTVQHDVTLTASGTEKRVDVMAVNLDWSDAMFTYDRGASTKTWNPSTHQWEWSATTAAWTKSSGNVGISNHSSVAIEAALKAPVTAHGWTVSQSGDNAVVAAAYDGNDEAAGTVKTGSLKLAASGIPTAGGTLTSTIDVVITPKQAN